MKILTVISNYNEEGAIADTIRDVQENATIQSDLLVIDNSSNDRSMDIIKKMGVDYLQHPVNTGGSEGVIKTALLYAYLNDYDVYCHMDGDNQHNANELKTIVDPILEGDSDIVIGSRFIEKKGFQSFAIRKMGIYSFSSLFSNITGKAVTDITSGFRAYNRKAIEFFADKFKHPYEPCLQMLMIAHYAGLEIKEVPVIMKPRTSGKSEINFKNAVKFPFFAMISIFGIILQRDTIRKLTHAAKR